MMNIDDIQDRYNARVNMRKKKARRALLFISGFPKGTMMRVINGQWVAYERGKKPPYAF